MLLPKYSDEHFSGWTAVRVRPTKDPHPAEIQFDSQSNFIDLLPISCSGRSEIEFLQTFRMLFIKLQRHNLSSI
jgi:hypothetical protein